MFFMVRLVRPGAPWGSLCSFRFVWFVQVHTGGRLFRSGSSAMFWSTQGVDGFVTVRFVRMHAP